MGLVKSGGDVAIADGVITINDDSHAHVISNVDGLQSALDAKATVSALSALSGLVGDTAVSTQIETAIASKADTGHTHSTYVNQNEVSNVKVGTTTIAADSVTDTLTLTAGSNITLTPDASGDGVTIAAKDTVYTHPSSGVTAGIYKSVTVDANGHVTAGTNPTTLAGYGITDGATKTELNNLSKEIADLKENLTLGVHTDGLMYIFVDGEPVGVGVQQSTVGGDVFGNVDSNNTITLMGSLSNGNYSIKYEKDDGTVIDIGNLELADKPTYINQIPVSINVDETPFVGTNGEKGYKTGYRLSLSGGGESVQGGTEVTGFIPATKNSVIRIKDIVYSGDTTRGMVGYDKNFTKLTTGNGATLNAVFGTAGTDEGNGVTASKVLSYYTHFNSDSLAYIRICSTDINENSILTVDQPITD